MGQFKLSDVKGKPQGEKPRAAKSVPEVKKVRRASMKDVGKDPETGKVIPHERNELLAKRVAFHVAAGMGPDEICEMLNIRPGQLKECYGNELKHGLNKANVSVAKAVYDSAIAGDTTAGKFWLKARAGWKDGEGAQGSVSPLQIHIHDGT